MKVREIMTQNVECVTPDMSIREAAAKMKELDVGPLPVCDNDRLAGMITDRDIATRVVAEGKDPEQTKVRDAMTPEVIYCSDEDDVADAARHMRDKQIRRIVVLDRDKHLCGIMSLGDVSVRTHDAEIAGNTLEGISEPAQPQR